MSETFYTLKIIQGNFQDAVVQIYNNYNVLVMTQKIKKCIKKEQEWMIDPSPILNDSALLFPEFPPAKNDVRKSLYTVTTESIENLTKQALSIIFHNFMVCITRLHLMKFDSKQHPALQIIYQQNGFSQGWIILSQNAKCKYRCFRGNTPMGSQQDESVFR